MKVNAIKKIIKHQKKVKKKNKKFKKRKQKKHGTTINKSSFK